MGQFREGQWLRLNELEKRYDVSRFEARKALAHLASLNALEYVTNYGYRVREAEPGRDAHHREVRAILELSAAPMVIANVRKRDMEQLRKLAGQFEWAIENKTLSESIVLNNDFHRAFFALAGNPILADMINDMRELAWPHSLHPYASVANSRLSAKEHFEMIDAVERKDIEALCDVMRRHLLRADLRDSHSQSIMRGLEPPPTRKRELNK